VEQAPQSKTPHPGLVFAVGTALTLLPWGLQMIGVALNLLLGALVLTIAFIFMARYFKEWDSNPYSYCLFWFGRLSSQNSVDKGTHSTTFTTYAD
jgi:hypothetical protein